MYRALSRGHLLHRPSRCFRGSLREQQVHCAPRRHRSNSRIAHEGGGEFPREEGWGRKDKGDLELLSSVSTRSSPPRETLANRELSLFLSRNDRALWPFARRVFFLLRVECERIGGLDRDRSVLSWSTVRGFSNPLGSAGANALKSVPVLSTLCR